MADPSNNNEVRHSGRLTHEEREREQVAAERQARCMTPAALRIARARLADVCESNPGPILVEVASIRGAVVHQEIERRNNTSTSALGRLLRHVRAESDSATIRDMTNFDRLGDGSRYPGRRPGER
jgi:hypothetical protein